MEEWRSKFETSGGEDKKGTDRKIEKVAIFLFV